MGSYLSGTLKLQWKKNFLQFIVDSKIVSVTNIDWNVVLEKWPFCTKVLLTRFVSCFSKTHGNKGVPLYKNIAENLHRQAGHEKIEIPQAKLDIIDAFEKL